MCATGNLTLAQVKAGAVVLPPYSGHYTLVGGWFRAVGADCATATSVNVNDTTGTNVVNVAYAVGPIDNGVLCDFDAASNVTRTTYGAANTHLKGIQIVDVTKGTLTGPDSLDYCLFFQKSE